jgi:Fe2+ or Zn2+ uptake regulation protein
MARPPRVRTAVVDLLAAGERPSWSIREIVSALATAGVRADFSSVYRALERLVAEGSARRLELGGAGARFELGGDRHAHIRCESCGAESVVPDALVEDHVPTAEQAGGFAVTDYELRFHGLCPECQAADKSGT